MLGFDKVKFILNKHKLNLHSKEAFFVYFKPIRYGKRSFEDYKRFLPYGIYNLCQVLPEYTVFLWTTTMPLSKEVRGGFMIPECENMMRKFC
jgi:hypothetical protein